MSTQADQLGERVIVTGRAYILPKVAWLGRGAARARLVASLMAGGIGRADKGHRRNERPLHLVLSSSLLSSSKSVLQN
jgi:hypothetical protein